MTHIFLKKRAVGRSIEWAHSVKPLLENGPIQVFFPKEDPVAVKRYEALFESGVGIKVQFTPVYSKCLGCSFHDPKRRDPDFGEKEWLSHYELKKIDP
jgi:hypothetical protein